MHTLREYIQEAEEKKIAIGHFNISDTEALRAVFFTAKRLNVPVIIGVSEGERDFIGVRQVVALVHSLRDEHQYPIFLNADHTYSFERIQEAVDAGFDAVIIDGAKLSLEDNIALSKKSVEYVRQSGKNTIIEGELGYIGTSSKILDDIPEGASITADNLTKAVDLKRYVDETGVDLVAPAVGNLHGMLRSGKEPALHIPLISELRAACGRPMVLHGGSGTSDQDFKDAIQAGISIVHINTEIRVAYRKGLEQSLAEHPDEVAPYKFMAGGVAAMEKVIEARLSLFNSLNS
jgi:fructose-bisphosphate aldolase class II